MVIQWTLNMPIILVKMNTIQVKAKKMALKSVACLIMGKNIVLR